VERPDSVVESAQHVHELAEELERMPAGRLAAAVPLTAIIGEGIKPFHRNANSEPSPRWVGIFLGVCAVLFVPYIVQLGLQLPARVRTDHYRAAWVGLDVMELLALGATAWFAWTRSTWIAISAAMATAFLVTDAWFDTVTAHSMNDRVLAIVEAVLVELPMAAFCLWIARHAEVVADRATRLLLRRSARQARRIQELERS
jgi:hypothetical protein